MEFMKTLYSYLQMFNLFVFVFFILQNVSNLNAIPFVNPFTGGSFTINIYIFIGVLVGLVALIAVSGINVMGSGLNDTSTSLVRKIVFLIIQIVIYATPLSFYFFTLGVFGSAIVLIDIILLLMYKIQALSEE